MERVIPNLACCCAMVALLLGGCSSQPPTSKEQAASERERLMEAVAGSVQDPQRSAQVRALTSEVSKAIREHYVEIEAGRARWFTLFSKYDSEHEKFKAIHTELRLRRQRLIARLIDLSLQIRDVMTPEEWAAAHDRLSPELSAP